MVGANRVSRGGWYEADATYLAASARYYGSATVEGRERGFRVAAFPEPNMGLFPAIAMLVLLRRRQRR